VGALTIVAKYLITANLEVQGTVEKYDIVGALFSQTEGLLGHDLDLRDLQMSGRIGRIEVELEHKGDKTVGKLYIPSNLDRYETALIAAMIETVDKVGPYNARVQVVEIKDLREEKRRRIVERARELLSKIEQEVLPDTKELLSKFMESVREMEIVKYGPEGLPAGPEVDSSDTVIIVEGRADVVNLLRHGFKNVIAIEGASGGIPKSIVDLSKRKTTVAFVDGDRGGEMLLKELLKHADIDYVARAPQGKEVEQLTAKEIIKALRNKIPVEEYLNTLEKKERQLIEESRQTKEEKAETSQVQEIRPPQIPQLPQAVVEEMKKLSGTLEAVIYDSSWSEVKRVPVRDLVDTLQQLPSAYAVVFDGVCTQRLVDVAANKGVKVMVMSRVGNIAKVPADMAIITIEEYLKNTEQPKQ